MGSRNVGLEELRAAFADPRTHIAIAVIKKLAVLSDRSAIRAQVSIFPDEHEIIATMSWESVGPGTGIFELPEVGDLVLVAFADGDVEQAFVIKRLTSKADPMPTNAVAGNLVLQAKKEAFLTGTKVRIGRKDTTPAEPLVLGTQLKTALDTLLTQLDALVSALQSGPLVICSAPGAPGTTYPGLASTLGGIKSALTTLKSTYVTTAGTNIVSQTAFTER